MKICFKKVIISLFLVLAFASGVFAMSYEEAATQDKPIVVMFHMHGCGGCRKFSPIFKQYSKKFSDRFNFVKEEIYSSKIAKTLSFDTVPALFIINPKTQSSKQINENCMWDEECFSKTLNEYK